MTEQELAFKPAHELAKLIRAKKVSPVEAVEAALKRIQRLNPKLNAFLYVAEKEAKEQAKAAETGVMKGEKLAPLHGVPISIKDLNRIKGMPTTFGSLVYKDFIPDEDDIVVERLRQSGAIFIGKTNTPEFGYLGATANRLGDHGRNPWDTSRIAGGSSGGAAIATACGMGWLAQGSDGGGSIRMPAAYCGIYGLKTTTGRIPHHSITELVNPFAVIGPMTRNVRDAALMLSVMAGYDRRDPQAIREPLPSYQRITEGKNKGLRIALSPELGSFKITDEVKTAVTSAAKIFAALGCVVEEANPPITPVCNDIKKLMEAVRIYASYQNLMAEHRDKLMGNVRLSLENAGRLKGSDYLNALSWVAYFRRDMDEFMEKYDLILTAATVEPASKIGERLFNIDSFFKSGLSLPPDMDPKLIEFDVPDNNFAVPFNMTGQPAASIPFGLSKEGLPIAFQIVGRWGDEATVLRASAAFEAERPWADRIPPIAVA